MIGGELDGEFVNKKNCADGRREFEVNNFEVINFEGNFVFK